MDHTSTTRQEASTANYGTLPKVDHLKPHPSEPIQDGSTTSATAAALDDPTATFTSSDPLLPSQAATEEVENQHRPKGLRFAILFTCILLGDFVTGYDTSCVETLTPVITDDFHALADVGWYGIAYLLALCGTMLIFGQLYTFFSMKGIFVTSSVIFTVGSVVSATAPSSTLFIVGRAISGLGSAGMFAGGSIIVANTTSLKYRPIYQALAGGTECIALAFGPVLSGAISSRFSWRTSFYVVVPIGVTLTAAVVIFVNHLQRPEHAGLTGREKLKKLDLAGFALYTPMVVCLVLGLQWAGIEYAWHDWRIIVLLALAGGLLVSFFVVEYVTGEESMFPLRMLHQRSVALACSYTFCNSAALSLNGYYLPIYFQAIRGANAAESGLMYLPTAVSFAVFILVAGPVTTFLGYFTPVMVFGSILMAIGFGLISTIGPSTPTQEWVLYQILYGVGIGLAFQQPYTAVQTVLPETKVPIALVTLTFVQTFGAIVALSVAQNIFVYKLSHKLAVQIPGLDPKTVIESGATGIVDSVPAQFREQVLSIYNGIIIDIFHIAVALVCLTLIGAVGIEWKSVKEEKEDE